MNTNKISSNNNENKSDMTFSQHKPGCPKYIPSNDVLPHTTIDNIKKMFVQFTFFN